MISMSQSRFSVPQVLKPAVHARIPIKRNFFKSSTKKTGCWISSPPIHPAMRVGCKILLPNVARSSYYASDLMWLNKILPWLSICNFIGIESKELFKLTTNSLNRKTESRKPFTNIQKVVTKLSV